MIQAILTVLFLAGLRVCFSDWKATFKNYMHYRREALVDPESGFFAQCSCGNCTPEEIEERKSAAIKHHAHYVNNLAKSVSLQIHQTLFHSGITVLALYFIIQLTINK